MTASSTATIANANVRELLKEIQKSPVDLSQHPSFLPFLDRVRELLTHQLQSEGAQRHFNLVLIDDMGVNAHFVEHTDGEQTIILNLGLLHFLENDDELLFVLGHEYNHGVSQIEEYTEKLRNEGEAGLAAAIHRSVENEVDLRSLLRWLHERGYNPHAARHAIRRLGIVDSISASHTATGSRDDVLNMAIVGLERGGGQSVKRDEPSEYSRTVLGPLRDTYLTTQQFADHQLQRVRTVLDSIENSKAASQVDRSYQFVATGETPPDSETPDYNIIYTEYHSEISALIGDRIMSPEDVQDLNLELQRRVQLVFENARRRHLPEGFIPPDEKRFVTLLTLEGRQHHAPSFILKRTYDALTKAKSKFRYVSEQKDSSANHQSLLRTAQNQLDRAQKDFKQYRRLFDGPQVDEALERSTRDHSLTDELRQILERHARVLGPFIQLKNERLAHFEKHGLPQILEAIANSENPRHFILRFSRELTARPEVVHATFQRLVRLSVNSFQVPDKDVKEAHDEFLWDWSEVSSSIGGTFADYYAKNPTSAAQEFRNYLRDLIPNFAKHGLLPQLIGTYSSVRRPAVAMEYNGLHPLLMSPKLTREVFADKSFSDLYYGSFREFISREVVNLSAEKSVELLKVYSHTEKALSQAAKATSRKYQISADDSFFHHAADAITSRFFGDIQPPPSELSRRAFLAAELGIPFPQGLRAFTELTVHPQARDLLNQRFSMRALQNAFLPDLNGKELHEGLLNLFSFAKLDEQDPPAVLSQFLNWLAINHPDRIDVAARTLKLGVISYNYDDLIEPQKKMLLPFIDGLRAKYAALEPIAQARNFTRDLVHQAQLWHLNPDEITGVLSWCEKRLQWPHKSHRIAYLNAFFSEGLRQMGPHVRDEADESMRYDLSTRGMLGFALDGELNDILTKMERMPPGSPLPVDLPLIAEGTALLLHKEDPSPEKDAKFELIWEHSQSAPAERRHFSNPDLISRLFYDENRRTLAISQVENEFDLESVHRLMKTSQTPHLALDEVRPEVLRARDFVNRQFAEPSAVKNEVLDLLQRKFMTTAAETALLDQGRLNLENWHTSKRLALLDAPRQVANLVKDNLDRIELVEYLNGMRKDIPDFVRRTNAAQDQIIQGLRAARRQFVIADPVTRSYVLQSLLDSSHGILEDPHAMEILTNRILGPHAQDPVFRAIFDSYMESLSAHSPGEKQVILGHVLGSFADRSAQSREGALSVRAVLEAMGPFGIKAGQFLRSSGLVTPALRADLDHFFDNALPPSRGEIFRRLRLVFGEHLPNINSVRQLVGAGSLNYVVLVDFQNPKTGRNQRAVVRFSKSTNEDFRDTQGNVIGDSLWQRVDVAGQIEHENKIWQRATASLIANPNAKVIRIGHGLEEARAHSMATLGRDGPELNLSFERRAYPEVASSYNSKPDPVTQFSVEVVPPNAELQALVPKRFSNLVSVYEYVDHTPLSEVQPASLRAGLARQIIDSEMRALLHNGVFDPDGQRGNWLVDVKNKRLRRIDYSQRQILSPESRQSVRQVLTLLITPEFETSQIRQFAEMIPRIFHYNGTIHGIEGHIGSIITEPDFPHFANPHERLFFIHRKLEERVSEVSGKPFSMSLQPDLRSAVSSLLRISMFREQAGDRALGESLLANLNLGSRSYVKALIKEKLSVGTRSIAEALTSRGLTPTAAIRRLLGLPPQAKSSTGIPSLDCVGESLRNQK